jgi:cytochrome c-type biogenesis protein CcmH
MTLFWILAALLIACALLFVLPPLLKRSHKAGIAAEPLNIAVYRDQQRELDADRSAGTVNEEQYERARLELERRLLDDVAAGQTAVAMTEPAGRAVAIIVGLAVPLLAVGLYYTIGNPRALTPVALPTDADQRVTPEQIEAMVAKLAERMKQNPDPKGWAMLAKSYAVMGRFEDAVAAYGKAAQRMPDNPDLLADYADALAMARGQSLLGEPEALVARALKADPDHPKALALAGTIAFDKKDYAGAIQRWEKLAATIPPDSDMARNVQAGITEARTLAGGSVKRVDKPLAEKSTAQTAAAASVGGGMSGVSGSVSLASTVAAKAAPGDTVFIFARAAEGPRMPLAILRKKVSDLPITFTLDDSTAMSPATRLSGTPLVIIGARISKSGDAMPKPGDLQGFTKPVTNSAKNITIVIDTEVQ